MRHGAILYHAGAIIGCKGSYAPSFVLHLPVALRLDVDGLGEDACARARAAQGRRQQHDRPHRVTQALLYPFYYIP
jgi:hypothetical protein